MHVDEKITRLLLDAVKRGEVNLDSDALQSLQRVIAAFDASVEAGRSEFASLLTGDAALARISGNVFARYVIGYCEQEVSRYEQEKGTRSLDDGDKTYMLESIFPLFRKAVDLAARCGHTFDTTDAKGEDSTACD